MHVSLGVNCIQGIGYGEEAEGQRVYFDSFRLRPSLREAAQTLGDAARSLLLQRSTTSLCYQANDYAQDKLKASRSVTRREYKITSFSSAPSPLVPIPLHPIPNTQHPAPRLRKQASLTLNNGFWFKIFDTGTPKAL
jgi:hypothetical protein